MPQPSSGLPPRIYVPIFLLIAAVFLALFGYLLAIGFGTSGSIFGASGRQATQRPANMQVQGGPPPAVAAQVQALQGRIAAHPNDDVALTQLGDMYLTVGKFGQAVDLYKRALTANPKNVAAKTGLEQAESGLHQEQ